MPRPSLFFGSAMTMRQSGHFRCSLRPKMAPLKPPPTMTTVLAAKVMAGLLFALKRCLHNRLREFPRGAVVGRGERDDANEAGSPSPRDTRSEYRSKLPPAAKRRACRFHAPSRL